MSFLVIVFALPLLGQDRSWVAESNRHAEILLSAQAKLAPESAGSLGLPGLDGEIRDLSPGLTARARKVLTEAKTSLVQRRREATHPLVRQDLDIMILAAAESLEGLELNEKYEIPYFNAVGAVFGTAVRPRWCGCGSTLAWSPASNRLRSTPSARPAPS